eukprot:TRINITY_DN1985_c0_g1_i1.p1 TRINITY_DN1985_c0_g1~~TRINITY_DN1985_c0_g1_i1.p1  ORF type:complete len:315 (-),score=63.94 TRINITY_DN1985_c0_g1_i1:34-954(-)
MSQQEVEKAVAEIDALTATLEHLKKGLVSLKSAKPKAAKAGSDNEETPKPPKKAKAKPVADDSSSEEEPKPKPKAKAKPVADDSSSDNEPAKPKPKAKAKPAADDSSSDDEPAKPKPKPKPKPAADSDSDEEPAKPKPQAQKRPREDGPAALPASKVQAVEGVTELVLRRCPQTIKDDHVYEHVKSLGDGAVERINWVMSKEDGSFRGLGFVRFATAELAAQAAALGAPTVDGQTIIWELNLPREGGAGGRGGGRGFGDRGRGFGGDRGGRGGGRGFGGRGRGGPKPNTGEGAFNAAQGKKVTFDD